MQSQCSHLIKAHVLVIKQPICMNLLRYSSSECCSWYRTSKACRHVSFAFITISYVWIRSIASLCDWHHGGTTVRQPRWRQTWHHRWGISDWSITVITTEGWVPWSSKWNITMNNTGGWKCVYWNCILIKQILLTSPSINFISYLTPPNGTSWNLKFSKRSSRPCLNLIKVLLIIVFPSNFNCIIPLFAPVVIGQGGLLN